MSSTIQSIELHVNGFLVKQLFYSLLHFNARQNNHMVFSHKTQIVSIALFACTILLSIVYIVLICLGVTFPDWLSSIAVTAMSITAILAPFSNEKAEDENVKSIRARTAAAIMAAYFCLIMLHHIFSVILHALNMADLTPEIKIVSPRIILMVEIIYFIILKLSVRTYMKKL